MQADWRTVPLEDALQVLIDYRGKSPPKSKQGVPVISAKVVKDGRVLHPIEQRIDPTYYNHWMTRGLPEVGDVVMTTEGPMGEVAQLDRQTAQYALGQRIVCMRGKEGVLDNTFLKFLLLSPRQQAILHSYATGTTVAGISQKALRSIPIAIPDYSEQLAIAKLLGALDDKIKANRQMNETLEATARALFKDWFVDFGPTRAKLDGRSAYLAPDCWSLFPNRLDNDGKPAGWQNGRLGDVAIQLGESVRPETLKADTPYIGLEHMPRRSIALENWEGAGKVSSGKSAFTQGAFLFGKLRPYFHKVGIAPVNGICSTDIVVLDAKSADARSFVIMSISQDEFVAFTDRTADGTKMPRTSWSRMAAYPICIPDAGLLQAFNALTGSMLARIVSNIHEMRVLAETRDLLLPKLMSGELRVKNSASLASAGR